MNQGFLFPNSYKNVLKLKKAVKRAYKKYNISSVKKNAYKNTLKYLVFLALYTCMFLMLFINPTSRTKMFKFILGLSPDMREYSKDLEESIVYLPVALKFCSEYNKLYKNFVVKHGVNSFLETLMDSVPSGEKIPGEFPVIEETVRELEEKISKKLNEEAPVKEDFVDLETISKLVPDVEEEIKRVNSGSPNNIFRRTQEFILSLNG